jgi:VWFA-related protein
MMTLLKPLPSVLLISLLAPAAGYAQQLSANASPTTVQVREVILPVTVRDKSGKIVPNLKQEDFILEQDSRPQVIKSFAHESNLPFRLGLLVDTSRSQENALPAEKSASGKFIDQMLNQPADKAFLLHFDRDVELLQDFTSAKAKLHRELDEMASSHDSGGSSGDSEDRGGRRRGGTQMYDAIYLASNDVMLKESGRKALIVLSDGVDRGSKESLNDAIDAAEKANVSVYTVYFKGEEGHRDSGMIDQGPRGGGYPGGGGGYPGGGGGYPGGGRRGGQRPGTGTEAHTDGKKILEQIARRTGGRFYEAKKKDSFDEVYAQISEELRGQYLLTYTPDKPASKDDSDGFHKISLKAKDDKLVVVTREGYYAID